jgi:hypothetical protein
MATALTLDDAFRKLWWAYAHYQRLRTEVQAFEQDHDYSITVQSNIRTDG